MKAKAAIEALKGNKTINEIAAEFTVHPNQVSAWKKQLLERSTDVFATGAARKEEQQGFKEDDLLRQIGQLKVELDWLKKKTGHLS